MAARKKVRRAAARRATKRKTSRRSAPRDGLTQTSHYDYEPIIDRPPFTLPQGARVAVIPFINIEHFPADVPGTPLVPGTAGFVPDPLNYGWRDYGNRVGLWRVMQLMDDCGMRGTVCLNGEVIREYPRIVEEGEKRASRS